jgi:hypothetical protein
MFGAVAITIVPIAPRTTPVTIQGRRMPHRLVVRSLSLPNSGLATMERSDPTPATRARLLGAAASPTRSRTFRASETSSGARNSSDPPV